MMQSVITSMVISFLLITILNIILMRSNNKLQHKITWQHYFFGYLFMLYLMISLTDVVGFPYLTEWKRLSGLNLPLFNPNINLVPFSDGLEISNILNIIFFMPFGFLLPTLWRKYRTLWPTLCYGLLFSLIIEVSQMFTNGRGSDINDLIMNTLGTLCGFIIFKVMSKIFHKLSDKTAVLTEDNDAIITKLEPYLYIGIAMISTFLG